MLASAALPAALVCAFVLAASGEEAAPELDGSWDVGYDRWEHKHAFVNGLPSVEEPKRGLLGEAAGDPFGLVTAKKTRAKQLNCGKAHAANQYACDAYGEHSPVCTGSQAQYVLRCGASQPKPLFSQQVTNERLRARFLSLLQEQTGVAPPTHKLLGDGAATPNAHTSMTGMNSTTNSTTNSTGKPAPMKSLQEVLEPILVGCQKYHDQAKSTCKQSVADGYLDFKSDAPSSGEQGEDDTVQQISDDLGSSAGIDRVYARAMDEFHRQTNDNVKQQQNPAPPADDVSAAAKFANDELFDHLRTFKHIPDVEEMAVGDDESLADYPSAGIIGDDESLADYPSASMFGPY